MKVLLINQAYFPDESATAQYARDLAAGLLAAGHQVTVLASNRGYLRPFERYPGHDVVDGVSVVRVRSPAFSWRFKLLRILDSVLLNGSMLKGFYSLGEFDCTLCLTSPPLLGALISMYVPAKKGSLVHWAMDINPDQAFRAGWIRGDSFLGSLLGNWQRRFYHKCNLIIALDRFMKKLLIEKGVSESKVHVLPLWVSDDHANVSQRAIEAFRSEFDLGKSFTVMYAGNHSLCHPLDAMLEAAFTLRENNRIRFVFIGGGSRVREVQQFAQEHSLTNVLQIPYQSRERVPAALAAADLQVVSCGSSYVGIVHPSKVYPFLLQGVPFVFLGIQESSVGDLIAAGAFGYCIDSDDGAAFCSVIEKLTQLSQPDYEAKSEQSRRVGQLFRQEKVMKELIQVLEASIT